MSGGRYDYKQYELNDFADDLERIAHNGREVFWGHGEEIFDKYPEDISEAFLTGARKLREASVYLHRADWLLSGDDGEDSFRERLKEDLEKL